MEGPPTGDLAGVETAFALMDSVIGGLTDEDARGASRLPGWTRGHLLTHIARNADSHRGMVEGALRNEVVEQYPGGAEQRTADIEAGADRSADDLLIDVYVSQRALANAWAELPDDGWDRPMSSWHEIRPVRDGVLQRWREIIVHLVDLDIGVDRAQLPAEYVVRDAEWLAENRGW
jgi:maleylpyruvate isomerase